MAIENLNITGLTDAEVQRAREKYGYNTLKKQRSTGIVDVLKRLLGEPMVILLMVASAIYFATGNIGDGIFLAGAIVLVSAISLFQHSRSRRALEKLKQLAQPKCKVVRNGAVREIKSEEVVVGDSLMVDEGSVVVADGTIVHSNDFSVNESILTGESLSVYKDAESEDSAVYRGTTVISGLAIAEVTAIGDQTELGRIGRSLESIEEERTPLEAQIQSFVRGMVIAGSIVFAFVWGINYFESRDILDSLLKALTLAMSILPEEIPVAFTTFMALGAWRLMKLGVVVKQMKTVETLGSATVICTDKTGTITENRMTIAKMYTLSSGHIASAGDALGDSEKELIRVAMWASEPIPFEPMEAALHKAYEAQTRFDERPLYKMIHEYPLGGKPPMMTHIFENHNGERLIAAKGAPEAILRVSNLSQTEIRLIESAIEELSAGGYRILAAGQSDFQGKDFPAEQQDLKFAFKGLIAFYDPPKENIRSVLEGFYNAGIDVKIVTGDNAETTAAIAKQIGFHGYDRTLTGEELMTIGDLELKNEVRMTQVFSRMFPEAKMKIVNVLKSNNEVVAMTGDGVNDAPALKSAHIGIAMGKRGTEIAKQAASLILMEDDLSKMVDAVAIGRKIYTNLKKAIRYIISIHIPIILTVFVPLVLGWSYPNIFSPIHIIFFELIMGPTCSIIYENEPIEKRIMLEKPRPFSVTFFKWSELTTSIVQGLVISAGALAVYQYAMNQGLSEPVTRTMVFVVLISANIFLTLVNRSFYYSIVTTLKYRNNLVFLIIAVTVAIMVIMLTVGPVTRFFGFDILTTFQLIVSVLAGCLCVLWFEIVKWRKRMRAGSPA